MFHAAAVGVEHLAKWPTAWGQLGSLVSYSCFLVEVEVDKVVCSSVLGINIGICICRILVMVLS